MERYAGILLLFASVAALQPPTTSKTYRDDYEYHEDTRAFYKLHTEEQSRLQASNICKAESAALLVPTSIRDLAVVHAMFKQFPDIGNLVWIADDGEVHESAEQEALITFQDTNESEDHEKFMSSERCAALNRDGQIEDIRCNKYVKFGGPKLPFVCKVDEANAPFDPLCDVYSKDYEYISKLGSCYKVSKIAYTWNQAYAECQHEGAHLVVLNSKEESREMKKLMSSKPIVSYYYIAGIRADTTAPRINTAGRHQAFTFRTIFNQTLEAAGFAEWADTEPNNLGGNECCGSLFETDGKYNDQDCSMPYGFICEKEKLA